MNNSTNQVSGRGRGRGRHPTSSKRSRLGGSSPSTKKAKTAKGHTPPTGCANTTPPKARANIDEDEKVAKCVEHTVQICVASSQLGCMLLHRNMSKQPLDVYNPFYNLSVNVRKYLDMSRLSVSSENDEDPNNKDNMLIRLFQSEASEKNDSPLKNTFVYAVASFSSDCATSPPLHLTYSDPKLDQGPSYYAVPITTELISISLKWLRASTEEVVVNDVKAGLNVFFKALQSMDLPNAGSEDLLNFIEDRDWTGTLWGGSKENFLENLKLVADEKDKWILLRRFINFNFGWQTKLLFFSVDGLHRTALSDTGFIGIAPPGANDKIKEMARDFSTQLKPESRRSNVIVNCYIPGTINAQICLNMKNNSASTQKDNARQANHSVIHTLQSILESMSLQEGDLSDGARPVGYLLDGVRPIYEMNGKGTTQEAKIHQFRSMLAHDFKFDEHHIENIIEEVNVQLKEKSKQDKLQPLDNTTDFEYPYYMTINILAEIYIGTWVYVFSGQLYSQLKSFSKSLSDIANIDPDIKMNLLAKMSELEFRRMFQKQRSRRYENEGKMKSYYVCPISFTDRTGPIQEALFGTSSFNDVLTDDIYKKPWKRKHSFPADLLELVWMILYTRLSKDSNKAILAFLNPTVLSGKFTHQVENNAPQLKARKMIRCLLLTINQSFHSSGRMWSSGFLYRDERIRNDIFLPLTMYRPSLDFFLLLSAIHHSCDFFAQMGHSPKNLSSPTEFHTDLTFLSGNDMTSPTNEEDVNTTTSQDEVDEDVNHPTFDDKLMNHVNGSSCTAAMSQLFRSIEEDEITKNTVNFIMRTRYCDMMAEKNEMNKKTQSVGLEWFQILSESVRRDLDPGVSLSTKYSIVNLSRGGKSTMTMEPEVHGQESIIQVFGGNFDPAKNFACSYRIGDSYTAAFEAQLFLDTWELVKEAADGKKKKATPLEAGAMSKGAMPVGEQQSSNNEGSAGGAIVSANNSNSQEVGPKELSNAVAGKETTSKFDEEGVVDTRQSSNHSKNEGTHEGGGDSHDVTKNCNGATDSHDVPADSTGEEKKTDGKKKEAKEPKPPTFSLSNFRKIGFDAGSEIIDLVDNQGQEFWDEFETSTTVEEKVNQVYQKLFNDDLSEKILRGLSQHYVTEHGKFIKSTRRYHKNMSDLKKNMLVLEEAVCDADSSSSEEDIQVTEEDNKFIDDSPAQNDTTSLHRVVDNSNNQKSLPEHLRRQKTNPGASSPDHGSSKSPEGGGSPSSSEDGSSSSSEESTKTDDNQSASISSDGPTRSSPSEGNLKKDDSIENMSSHTVESVPLVPAETGKTTTAKNGSVRKEAKELSDSEKIINGPNSETVNKPEVNQTIIGNENAQQKDFKPQQDCDDTVGTYSVPGSVEGAENNDGSLSGIETADYFGPTEVDYNYLGNGVVECFANREDQSYV